MTKFNSSLTIKAVPTLLLGIALWCTYTSILMATEQSSDPNKKETSFSDAAGGALGWTSSSFAMWYCWYMTARRLPSIEKKFGDERAANNEAHRKAIDSLDARYLEAMAKQESRAIAQITRLINDFRSDVNAFWNTKREDDAKLQACIERLAESHKHACHYGPPPQNPNQKLLD